MKKITIACLCVAVLIVPGLSRAQVPQQICGFVLGESIEAYKDKLNMDTSIPIRYMECIKEVEIKATEGIKTGLIGFGACTSKQPVVRIKIKYADSSKKFYEELLKRLKKRFGEPTEWRGDPFHIYLAWKWSFTDKDNNKITLNLSHNTMDLEEKRGNAVKLTMLNLIEDEQRCFKEKNPGFRKTDRRIRTQNRARGSMDWDLFLPR